MVQMLRFTSGGVELSGAFRPSRGRPTVVFCHGYPGRNLNEETAESLAARGYGSLVFSYRGARGSPGTYSFRGNEDDAKAALAAVRSRARGRRPSRLQHGRLRCGAPRRARAERR